MTYVLGIDVGTGGTRALVVDARGAVVGAATAEHVPFASPETGWAEQDPRDWWRATTRAVPRALAQAGVAGEVIAGVGLTGQMHGAVLLDDRGEVVRPALIWCDQRTARECASITDTVGAARLIELTANPALTGFTLPKLLWVRRHDPSAWNRVASVLLPKDYVRYQLSGVRATDVADASGTLLFDVSRRRWSADMLEAMDVSPSLLPEVVESPSVTGVVSSEGAAATGLRTGTPVVGGAGDQAAGAVGMGIVRPGAVSVTIGTSGVVFAATDRPARDPQGRVHTFCHAVPGRWHVMGVTQAAGLSLRWFRDRFGCGVRSDGDADPYEQLISEAAEVAAGADGVLWAPYLMGERTPHLDPHARAALVGLAASHTRGHVIRAILEGVTFSLRDSFTILAEMGVPVHAVRLGGGGARSAVWRQIQANVYAHVVERLQADEGAAYGAALLAGVGAGFWPTVEAACDAVVQVAERIAPSERAAGTMNRQYAAYRALYPALRHVRETASRARL
ncbi:MAG: xylulokinase [Luteitalea sp.]|nr:xylulokinase [Luteitalea sp.]